MASSGFAGGVIAADSTGRPASPLSLALKRLSDFVLALALLVVSLPLSLIGAAFLYASLGSPMMFRQRRMGLGMVPFDILKFRTMSDARDANGVLLPDAERQTPLSAIIRRLRIDELPQLLSILSGKMSFVGPRPLPPDTIAAFGEAGSWRCSVRPGLTGWAQVNGNTNLTPDEKIALDIWYVDHRSLALDLAIVVLTVRTILLGEIVDRRRIDAAKAHLARRMAAASAMGGAR